MEPDFAETHDTDLSLPVLVYGTSALGNLYRELDKDTKRQLVAEWIGQSVLPVCIDSAGKYGAGLALEELGSALRGLSIPPANVIISNKLGWKRVPLAGAEPTFEPGIWKNLSHDAVQSIGYDGILDCWIQGNELLGPPYSAQLLSVHDPDEYLAAAESPAQRKRRLHDVADAYRALLELKKSGKATAIGIGCKDWTVIRELSESISFDWIMLAGSFTVRVHSMETLDFINQLHRNGTMVINSALFNAGFLVGSDYFDYRRVSRDSDPELFTWRDGFHRVCRDNGILPADACVEFGLAPRPVTSVAMNTTRPDRVSDNVRATAFRAPAVFWEQLLREKLVTMIPDQVG